MKKEKGGIKMETSQVSQTVHSTNRWFYAIHIGFFAGLIWGLMRVIAYFFKLTSLVPGYLIEPFYTHTFLESPAGQVLGTIYFTLFSIMASLLYGLLFYKLRGAWYGLAYGLLWWSVIFLLAGPALGLTAPAYRLDLDTALTEGALYVMWGVFIGFSISFEFTDERKREPVSKESS
ncbi:YqhR family membrane protein [Marinicrinis sediminis]|uniref:YqhR family membrane protein n=1 Tax=Marinicrinis sediminis TaxID=1652465 RepID=A0ABW5REC5_9BACL